MKHRTSTGRRGERGSALIYILIAIALLALLTITFMEPSSQQTQSQNSFKLVSEIQSQVEFIRSSVQECVLTWPGGDDGTLPPNPAVQQNHPYPLNPEDAYLDNCVADPSEAAGDNQVKHLRCPGNPGDNPCHIDIFGGKSGKFLPPAPDLFGEWRWYNGDDGAFFWISTDKSDAFISTALQKLDESYAKCEADIIDATGGVENLDSGPTVTCANGNTCFRVWMIMKSATAVFPTEAGCP